MYAGFACAYFLHDYCNLLLSPQQVIDDLTKEKSEMEERLVDTEQRLNEFEETGQKFLHLQVKQNMNTAVIFLRFLTTSASSVDRLIAFLAHLSRRLTGELIGYPWIRRLSVCRPSVRSHFQTSPLKPLGQSKPNFMWSLLGEGERKFV